LEFKSEVTFFVINKGYEYLALKYQLPADKEAIPIQLEFPKGNTLDVDTEKIPVIISFTSSKSISFTGKIEFSDNDGQKFPIMVSGASDNSVLTNIAYLWGKPNQYDIKNKKTKGIYLEELPIDKSEAIPSGIVDLIAWIQAVQGKIYFKVKKELK
jgi:hypothetical protein